MRKWFGLLLIGLMGCAGRPEMGYFPTARSTVYAPAPERAEPLAARTLSAIDSLPAVASPAPKRRAPNVKQQARVNVSQRQPLRLGRAAVRRLARIRSLAAHVPASHAANGLAYLFWAALIVLGIIVLAVLLVTIFSGTTLGAVGAWILYGLLAAGVLYLGYVAFG